MEEENVTQLHKKIVKEERHLNQLLSSTSIYLHEHSLLTSFVSFLKEYHIYPNEYSNEICDENEKDKFNENSCNEKEKQNQLNALQRIITNIETMTDDVIDYTIDIRRNFTSKEYELKQDIKNLSEQLKTKTQLAEEEYEKSFKEYETIEKRIHQMERENEELQKEIERKLLEIDKKKEKIQGIHSAIEMKQKEKEDEFRKMLVSTISVGNASKRNNVNSNTNGNDEIQIDDKAKEIAPSKKPRRRTKQNLLFPNMN